MLLHQARYEIEIGFIVLNAVFQRWIPVARLHAQRIIQAGTRAAEGGSIALEQTGYRILQHCIDDLQHILVLEYAERRILIQQCQPWRDSHRVGAILVTPGVQLAPRETHHKTTQAAVLAFLLLPDPDSNLRAEHLLRVDVEVLGEQRQIVDVGTRDRFLADDAGRQEYILAKIGIDLDPCLGLRAVRHDASCETASERTPTARRQSNRHSVGPQDTDAKPFCPVTRMRRRRDFRLGQFVDYLGVSSGSSNIIPAVV